MTDHSELVPASRARKLLVGIVTLAALVGISGWLGGSYLGVFTDDLSIEAELPVSGDSLGVNSDVKYRGLRVGRVVSVRTGEHPVARVILISEHADEIPGDVRARVLPGTLFGNEYVDLVRPGDATRDAAELDDGAVVPADESVETVRLMDAFTSAQRLLVAIDPARLDAAISQLAGALNGRGDDLHRFLRDARSMVSTWEEIAPAFHRDVALIASNADTFADLEPAFIKILEDSLPLARLWAEEQKAVLALLDDTAALMNTANRFLRSQHPVIATMLRQTAAVTGVMARMSPEFISALARFPGVVENGAKAVQGNRIQMEGVIGLQLPAPYGPEDCPRYGSLTGRNCR